MRLLNLLLLAALLGGSLVAWPRLPPHIPAHFGLDGTADRWVETSWESWFLTPLVAAGMNALLHGLSRLSTRNPRYVNLPGKERLLALPPERQRAVLRRVQEGLEGMATPLTLALCLIQLGIYRTALGQGGRTEIFAALLVVILAGPIGVIAILSRTRSELDRQVQLHQEEALS